MKDLPNDVEVYKKTNIFDENSVPKALLKDHSTKANVWGKINVIEGKLLYKIQSKPQEVIELSPENFGVVEPEIEHHVELKGTVRFFVEFFK